MRERHQRRVITVLTESVTDDYFAFLQSKSVSYVFGGKSRIDVAGVLGMLRRSFGIKTLLIEGGGQINGSFLAAEMIDELSILVAPVADGSIGTPSLFDVANRRAPARMLSLLAIEKRSGASCGSGTRSIADRRLRKSSVLLLCLTTRSA